MDIEKLLIFHINDSEDLPKSELTDANRLLPGEGVIPLCDILSRLKAAGYDKLASIELFRPEYWNWDPYELGKIAKEKTEKLLRKYWK